MNLLFYSELKSSDQSEKNPKFDSQFKLGEIQKIYPQ